MVSAGVLDVAFLHTANNLAVCDESVGRLMNVPVMIISYLIHTPSKVHFKSCSAVISVKEESISPEQTDRRYPETEGNSMIDSDMSGLLIS